MDTVGDFLTVIRNAVGAHKPFCRVQFSNMRREIANLLQREGYLASVKEHLNKKGLKNLEIGLKYVKGVPVLNVLKRCSKPGARWYVAKEEIPNVLSGLGLCILSTSKGIMSGRQARKLGVGGELICEIW